MILNEIPNSCRRDREFEVLYVPTRFAKAVRSLKRIVAGGKKGYEGQNFNVIGVFFEKKFLRLFSSFWCMACLEIDHDAHR